MHTRPTAVVSHPARLVIESSLDWLRPRLLDSVLGFGRRPSFGRRRHAVWSVPFEPLGVPIGVVHILACLTAQRR